MHGGYPSLIRSVIVHLQFRLKRVRSIVYRGPTKTVVALAATNFK